MINFNKLFIILILFSVQAVQAQEDIFCGDVLTVDNDTGVNNLENYPERPGFSFAGPERILRLPVSECGEVCISVSNRNPNVAVDVFILTDPTDGSSNVAWIDGNGFQGEVCFDAVSDESYYAVIDGLDGLSIASVDVAVSCQEDCPDPRVPIPTMGQWGLMSLAMSFLIFGVVYIREYKSALA